MDPKKLNFETLQLHVGQEQPDPATDARAVPIYQTTSYVFADSAHAAARFDLKEPGNIYGRLGNPTQDVLERRIAALEGGVAALAVASGAAAVTYAIQNLAVAGDHIVAANTIYGGTYNLLDHTLPAYGVTTTFVDPSDLSNFERAIQPNTKAVFIETLGNPNSGIIDIDAVAEPVLDARIFDMTNHISARDYNKAAAVLGDLLRMQTEPIVILGAIGKELRRLYTARMALDNGKDRFWLMDLWQMRSDYPARLLLQAARRVDHAWCKRSLAACQLLDRRMKSEKNIDREGELVRFVMELAEQ